MASLDGALQTKLCDQALALGATYVGVADLAPVRDFVTAQGGEFLGDYRCTYLGRDTASSRSRGPAAGLHRGGPRRQWMMRASAPWQPGARPWVPAPAAAAGPRMAFMSRMRLAGAR